VEFVRSKFVAVMNYLNFKFFLRLRVYRT